EDQLGYWRSRLGQAPVLTLPTDHQRPAIPSFRGGAVPLDLPGWLLARLRVLASAEKTTLFTVLLAAWALLLGRLAGQSEVVIGAPVANRRRPELEQVVGFLANTLALRCDLGGRPSFREFL